MSRILLVDDSPHAQRMGERILSEEGYEVVTVSNADSALIRLEDVDPDVVLADAVTPFAAVVASEQIRAAVTVALDGAMEAMVDEIASRVLTALQNKPATPAEAAPARQLPVPAAPPPPPPPDAAAPIMETVRR